MKIITLLAGFVAGCAATDAPPYCVVKDAQMRDVIVFGPSAEQARRFDNSHINAKPAPVFKKEKP